MPVLRGRSELFRLPHAHFFAPRRHARTRPHSRSQHHSAQHLEAYLAPDADDVPGLLHRIHRRLDGGAHQRRRAGGLRHRDAMRDVHAHGGHGHVQRRHGRRQPVHRRGARPARPALHRHDGAGQPGPGPVGGRAGVFFTGPVVPGAYDAGRHSAHHPGILGHIPADPARALCLFRHGRHVPGHASGLSAAVGHRRHLHVQPVRQPGIRSGILGAARARLCGYRLDHLRRPADGRAAQLSVADPQRLA